MQARGGMTRFERLLVPVDFESPIELKLRLTAKLAKRFGAEVALLHANDSRRDAHARETLERAAAHELDGVPTRYVVVDGEPARAIVDVSRREDSDLVVLFPRAPIGSATRTVLLEADCDVLSFPPRAAAVERGDLVIRSILCGADFTANDGVVLPQAAELARALDAKLTLVHVTPSVRRYGPGGVHDVPELRDAFFAAAKQRFREVLRDARIEGTETLVCSADDIVAGLNDAVEKTRADLVVIGRRPCAGFSGGKCHRIASGAIAPVLALRT